MILLNSGDRALHQRAEDIHEFRLDHQESLPTRSATDRNTAPVNLNPCDRCIWQLGVLLLSREEEPLTCDIQRTVIESHELMSRVRVAVRATGLGPTNGAFE